MKKKILAIVLCVAMLTIAIAGGTMAYFTDKEAQTNTFTAGKVEITLDEAEVKKDETPTSSTYGDLIATGKRTSDDQDYGKLFPGQEIDKDPTIKLKDGSEDAYIAAKITVTSGGDIHSYQNEEGEWVYILGVEQEYDNINIHVLAKGGLLKPSEMVNGWNGLSMVHKTNSAVVYQVANRETNTYTFYVFILDKVSSTDEPIVLFEKLTIPTAWDNEEMRRFEDFSIDIQAFATQEYGFKDCFTAITTAFKDDFPFAPATP